MSVLPQLHRLRKYKEHTARRDLLDAQAAQRATEEKIRCTEERVAVSRAQAKTTDPAEMARHHAYALRMELSRRRDEAGLIKRRGEVARRRTEVRTAAVAARTVERLAEMREELTSTERRRTEQHRLDELGMMSWNRR